MKRVFKLQIILLVVIFSLPVFSSPAGAYVLKGPHVLDLVVKKLGRLRSLRGTQQITLYDKNLPEGSVELEEKVSYLFPDRFRSEIDAEKAKKTHISAFDRAIVLLDGKIISKTEGGFDHYKDLLLFRNRIMLQDRLSSLGVDLGVTSLKRYPGGIVFVIGAGQHDEKIKPQLWVDKETFLPVRWLLSVRGDNGDRDELDVWFRDWKKVKKSYTPYHIEFYKNGNLVREIRVRKIVINPVISENIFDIEAVEKNAEPLDESPREGDENEKSEIQKKIDGLDEIIKKDSLAF